MSELHRIGSHEERPADADLIFVHGLGGDPVLTWCHDESRSEDCWLYWLAEELPGVAVHTLAYEASLSGWLGRAMPLIDRAKDVLTELETMAIGARPIVFVGHYRQWVLERGERLYGLGGGATLEGLQLFDRERQQIVAGHAFALARAGETTGARLLAGYGAAAPYLINLRLHARERVAWHAAAVHACRRLRDRAAEGGRLTGLGNAYADCGDVAGAIRCYQEAVALARELGDRQQESVRLGNLGGAYADLGEPRRAIGCFSDALILARLCGDLRAEASHQGNLAAAYLALGRHHAALRCGERALRCAEQVGDRRGQGVYRANLASIHLCLDEVEGAVALYREALAIAEEIGDRREQGYRAGNLALALDGQDDAPQAAGLARQALEVLEELEEEPARQLRRLLLARFQLAMPPADGPPRGCMPEDDRRSS